MGFIRDNKLALILCVIPLEISCVVYKLYVVHMDDLVYIGSYCMMAFGMAWVGILFERFLITKHTDDEEQCSHL